ncbi:RbsD/FucU family protein [Arthrobacter sp. zg-Y820]|uniref:RbsD/FucU family protein n=1 Tax=unclassified Arthrobacter TaxID=235627 RepID=UPI001E52C53F|nr:MULTISPECIES: RbsD/FucU family protein [unclassified Arthrobacter]MCC9195387.1 RbsD/FucU family protein [Arthrobacter sp. zg-Y820]MDK1278246.1 RbsD/FucU family protein [Arthrobacter sp. zg.Y820]MDK1361280.1 RbsD/FucU family protein [Arthrobacter sp. zg-Y1219]WIB10127.1 RbsD/FucU family protein [Arthrobacter sp. zg-Y820]
MLSFELTHPDLLQALASSGHGTKVLIADGNYPHNTGAPASARRIALNLRPGLLTVDQILEVLAVSSPIESAEIMTDDDGAWAPCVGGYRALLGREVPVLGHERHAFYEAARGSDVGVVIASGDQRQYANLLLTIGVRTTGSSLPGA